MKAFNYADDYKGPELVDAIQNYCGIQEKWILLIFYILLQ
jgi:hypothetical protein